MPGKTDDQVNSEAVSYGAQPRGGAHVDDGGLPCLTVAGCTVFMYRRNGRLILSWDNDHADGDTPVVDKTNNTTPLTIMLNGITVLEIPAEEDLRVLRETGG
jgi:hypothetical protein